MPFLQSDFDSLCGVFSICNAEKIINNTTDEESQLLFNSIITYLSKKRKLKTSIIEGMNHRLMVDIFTNVIGDRIPVQITNKKNITKVSEFWKIAIEFLSEPERVIILSLDGKEEHYTAVKSMTERAMQLSDSGNIKLIRKSACKIKGYIGEDRYIIYPSQCFFLGKS